MMFQSLDFYNPAALDAAGHLTSPSCGRCLCKGTGQWRGDTAHKATWQGTIPPPHPVGRKTKALVHAHARWRDACWLQVSSSSTVSVPAPPDRHWFLSLLIQQNWLQPQRFPLFPHQSRRQRWHPLGLNTLLQEEFVSQHLQLSPEASRYLLLNWT